MLSLYRSGSLQNLIEVTQDYKIDLLAAQEVKWLGRSVTERRFAKYTVVVIINNIFGTGFIVSKHIRSRVIDFKPIDRRMCMLKIIGKFKNCRFIFAHAPTEEKSEREKDQFYEQLERMYRQCRSCDIKIIFGDMNVKVGKEI